MQNDEKVSRDEIIEEVERVREEIARRYNFDVDRIFEAVKDRSARQREEEQDKQPSRKAAKGSA